MRALGPPRIFKRTSAQHDFVRFLERYDEYVDKMHIANKDGGGALDSQRAGIGIQHGGQSDCSQVFPGKSGTPT